MSTTFPPIFFSMTTDLQTKSLPIRLGRLTMIHLMIPTLLIVRVKVTKSNKPDPNLKTTKDKK